MKVSTPEIAWHGKEPIFSIDFSQASNSLWRLASAGGDADIKIWKVDQDEDGNITTEFLSNLSRHTKTVNVVRFSTTDFLASGSDDGTIIIWKLAENYGSDKRYLESEDLEVRESWTVSKILRGHLEDVYDIAWSRDATRLISGSVDNSAIVWDVDKCQKLNILKEHTHYVQGVSWDPLNQYFMTLSSDRSCRVYSMEKQRSLYNISKLPSSRPLKDGETKRKYYRIFHEETLQTFFRRPNFSPDGKLMVVPAGQIEDKDDMKNTTFIFTRNSMSKPVVCLLSGQKASIAVRCCPVLFEKRDMKEASNDNSNTETEKEQEMFDLPYRMIIAVATLDSVILYDTQQKLPFAYISCIHYAALTDIAWSHDAKFLVVSSADGYCSLIAFADDELGVKRQLELCDNPQPQVESASKRKLVCTDDVKSPNSSISDQELDKTPLKMNGNSELEVTRQDTPSRAKSPTSNQQLNDTPVKPVKRAKLITLGTLNGQSPTSSTKCNENQVANDSPKVTTTKRATLITLSPVTNKNTNSESGDSCQNKEKRESTKNEDLHQYSANKIELLSSDTTSSSEESDKVTLSQSTQSSISPTKTPRRVAFKTIS